MLHGQRAGLLFACSSRRNRAAIRRAHPDRLPFTAGRFTDISPALSAAFDRRLVANVIATTGRAANRRCSEIVARRGRTATRLYPINTIRSARVEKEGQGTISLAQFSPVASSPPCPTCSSFHRAVCGPSSSSGGLARPPQAQRGNSHGDRHALHLAAVVCGGNALHRHRDVRQGAAYYTAAFLATTCRFVRFAPHVAPHVPPAAQRSRTTALLIPAVPYVPPSRRADSPGYDILAGTAMLAPAKHPTTS